MTADCLIYNTSEILTCAGPAPRFGRSQNEVGARSHAVIAAENGTIVFVGGEELVVSDMVPLVARQRLAEWCDVFCESGAFTPDESRQVLEASGRLA